ncbi:hypothetical protein Tco_1417440 [Tanacetum coccineum]
MTANTVDPSTKNQMNCRNAVSTTVIIATSITTVITAVNMKKMVRKSRDSVEDKEQERSASDHSCRQEVVLVKVANGGGSGGMKMKMKMKMKMEKNKEKTSKGNMMLSNTICLMNVKNSVDVLAVDAMDWKLDSRLQADIRINECKEFLAKSVDATKLASLRLSKCRFCSPRRKKKVRTRCSSQAPELHFVAENARVNNVNPEGTLVSGFDDFALEAAARNNGTGCNGYEYDAIERRVHTNSNLRHPKRFFDYTSVGEGWHASPEHSIFADFVSQPPIRLKKEMEYVNSGSYQQQKEALAIVLPDGLAFKLEYVHPYLDVVSNFRKRTLRMSYSTKRKINPVFTEYHQSKQVNLQNCNEEMTTRDRRSPTAEGPSFRRVRHPTAVARNRQRPAVMCGSGEGSSSANIILLASKNFLLSFVLGSQISRCLFAQWRAFEMTNDGFTV